MKTLTRRHFDFEDEARSYAALKQQCSSLAIGEELHVRIADRHIQSPQGLAYRLNNELSDQGVKARDGSAWHGNKRPKEAKVVVVRVSSPRNA